MNPRWMIESGVSNHWRGDTQPETCVVPSVPAVPLGRLQAVSVQAGRRLAEPEVGNFTEKDIYFLQKQPRSCNGCTAQRGTWSRHLCRCPRLWPSRHLFQPSSQLELPGLQLAKGQGVIPKEYAESMPAGGGGVLTARPIAAAKTVPEERPTRQNFCSLTSALLHALSCVW